MDKNNRCWMCGEQLDENNCRPNADSISGYSFMCIGCEQDTFDKYAQTQGKYHALFTMCAMLNVPLIPLLLDGINLDEEETCWITYINLLSDSGQDRKKEKLLGFKDGATTLWGLFGTSLSQKDFAARIKYEKDKIKKQSGTSEQRERWGTSADYKTNDDYNELDGLYEARASSFKGQTITPQMENTLINVAKWTFKMNKLLESNSPNFHGAKALSDMIDKALASENMRKKDEKPVENFRMDALIVALEKAGCMENGDFLGYDELIEVLRDKFIKSPKYNYSLDVADQMLLDFINATRGNADLMPIFELQNDLKAVDEYNEFKAEPTKEEIKRKKFIEENRDKLYY